MLLEFSNVGYQMGAAGIVFLTVAYLIVVRWWTDHLGRVIAGVLSAMSGILIITTLRMLHPEYARELTYQVIRLIMFWMFGLGVWTALGSFVWAQFFARRLRANHLDQVDHTEGEVNEEDRLAGSRSGRDGDSDDRAAGGVG